MRCPKCGKKLEDVAKQCPVCKTVLSSANPSIEMNKKATNNTNSAYTNQFSGNAIKNKSTYHYSGVQNKQPTQQQQQFQQQPQTQLQSQTYSQQSNTKFCGTCGAVMNPNSTFCSRCGAVTSQNVNRGTNIGARLLNLSYSVYVLLATNLFLVFTTFLNFLVYSPSAEDYWKDGLRADVKYTFWELSSRIWETYKAYKESSDRYNRMDFEHRYYWSEPRFNYWSIIVVILMYVAALVCAVFVIRAFAKAYSNINSNNPSSLSVLSNLRISSISAIVQVALLIILKAVVVEDMDSGKFEGVLSFTFWFYLVAILAIGSLIAEIFLIKANGTSAKSNM